MKTKTIVVLLAITVVVLMMTIDEANAQRPGRCRRCRGGPQDRCVIRGARCPATCRNRNPRPCGTVRFVCRCERGTIRAPNGRCVPPNQCPRTG